MSAMIVAINDQPGVHQFFDECLVTADVLSHPMDNLEEPARRLTIAPARARDSQPVRAGHFELFASQRLHSSTRDFQTAESAGPDRLGANSELRAEIADVRERLSFATSLLMQRPVACLPK